MYEVNSNEKLQLIFKIYNWDNNNTYICVSKIANMPYHNKWLSTIEY